MLRFPLLPSLVLLFLGAACPASEAAPRCAEGMFDCLGRCLPLGSVCGSVDGGPLGPADAGDPPTGDAGSRDAGPRDDAGIDAGASVCGETATGSRCMDESGWRECGTGLEEACPDTTYCQEWTDAGGTRHAGCYPRGTRPCDEGDEGAARCDGPLILWGCRDSPSPGPHRASRERNYHDCLDRWSDGVCEERPDGTITMVCSSPTAPVCDPDDFTIGCTSDGTARTVCDASAGLEYEERCEPSETCRVCPSGPARCIPDIAVPTDHVHTGPGLYDLLRCVGASRVRVAQCGWEWTASCPADEPVCHDELTGGARCYPEGIRFCTTPGERECSSDFEYAYECASVGFWRSEWCAGEGMVCDAATGRCQAP